MCIVVFFIRLNIVSNSKVSEFFLTEWNFRNIWLIPYFWFTHLYTASLSFIVSSEQLLFPIECWWRKLEGFIFLLVQLKKIDNSKLSAFFLNTEYNFRTIWLIPYFYALTFIHHHCHSDWFQLNMSTFSTCALIQGHQKTGTKISQPISQIFLKFNSSVKHLLFELCTGIFLHKMYSHLRLKICTRFVPSVLIFSPKYHFPFLRLKNHTNLKGINMWPLK